jgi:RNA polymerase sigma factor (sigma-70 family)
MDDSLLLSRYVDSGCQESFEAIVTRHSGWVFSVSLRAVHDRHLAEDVTQAVFLILARKAATIRPGTPLSGWLFKVSRFAVSDALKRRTRMRNRENRFAEFFKTVAPTGDPNSADDNISDELSACLDEAVACLSESDRQAVLLRFYEGKSLAEVGQILGASEEAAKKRVSRAVDKLRKHFAKRGVVAPLALLLLLLAQRSSAAGILPDFLGPGAVSHVAQSIAQGALKLMASAQARLLGAILAAGLALFVGIHVMGGADPSSQSIPVPVAFQPATLPAVPSQITPVPPATLPQSPRFADLWIGYKGQLLWRSDAFADPPPTPFLLKFGEQHEKPYAVAVDPRGNFFIKPLDQAILESPVIRLAQNDYDPGPVNEIERVHSMLSLIDPPPAGFSILPDVATKALAEQDWHKLRRSQDDDGTIVVEPQQPFRFNNINVNLDGIIPGDGRIESIEVPEPATLTLLLGAGALLLRRRRRRVANRRDFP